MKEWESVIPLLTSDEVIEDESQSATHSCFDDLGFTTVTNSTIKHC